VGQRVACQGAFGGGRDMETTANARIRRFLLLGFDGARDIAFIFVIGRSGEDIWIYAIAASG